MKKTLIILSLFMAFIATAQNGKGRQFPTVTGETFTEKNVTLPDACKGKPSIIGICFSKNAEGDLKTWLNPAYNEFVVKKDTTNSFGATAGYDINFYFIPMMNLVNQVLEKASKEKIKKDTDKAFWPHLLFYLGGLKEYKKALEIQDNSQPYFFVLDKNGKIIHVEKGAYSDKKMSNITDHLDED